MTDYREMFKEYLPDPPKEMEQSLRDFNIAIRGEKENEFLLGKTPEWCLNQIIQALDSCMFEDALRYSKPQLLKLCVSIGVCSMMLLDGDREARVEKVMNGILMAKNHDYGNSFCKFGSWGVGIRMSDKVIRMICLLSLGEKAARIDESIEDTACDLLGYSALLYTCLRSEQLNFQKLDL